MNDRVQALVNDAKLYSFAKEVATQLVGSDAAYDTPALMTGEDFAFIADIVPSAYLFIGIRNETLGSVHELHTPQFKLDEQVKVLTTCCALIPFVFIDQGTACWV